MIISDDLTTLQVKEQGQATQDLSTERSTDSISLAFLYDPYTFSVSLQCLRRHSICDSLAKLCSMHC